MTEFQIGDRVSIMATVVYIDDIWPVIHVDHQDLERIDLSMPERLTLVERPKRQVTVTLDEDQLRYLFTFATEGFVNQYPDYVDGAYSTLDAALECLDD